MSFLKILITFGTFVYLMGAQAAVMTYQGRVVQADGQPLVHQNVQFTVQVRSPDSNNCIIYQETHTLNMEGSDGIFSLNIGDGVRASAAVDGGHSLFDVLSNKSTSSALGPFPNCENGNSFMPQKFDTRKLVISFNAGAGVQTLKAQTLSFMPYAVESVRVGGYSADNILRVTSNVATSPLNNAQYAEFLDLINGNSSVYAKSGTLGGGSIPPTLGSGESIRWSGTGWEAFTPGNAEAMVTSVTSTNSYMGSSMLSGAVSLTLNVGTTENTVAAGNDTRIVNAFQSDTSLSGDLSGTIVNPQVAKLQGYSVSNAAPTQGAVLTWKGSSSSWVPVSLPSCNIHQVTYFDSVNDVYACRSIAINTNQITAGVLGVSQGGTGVSQIPTNGQILVGNGSGYQLANIIGGTNVTVTDSAGGIRLDVDGAEPTGSAGGSLAGTYPNPTLALNSVSSGHILDGTIVNSDISNTAAIVDSKLSTIATPGKVSGNAITSGVIGGSTSLETTGDIKTSGRVIASDSSSTTAQVEVSGQILSKVHNAGNATHINWNNGNVQYTAASCGNFTFENMFEGGSYTLIVKGANSGTCLFSQAVPDTLAFEDFLFRPSGPISQSDTATIITFLRAGGTVYGSWITGFQ
ncbi:hypothetical protein BDW_08440 [Bdellovibrio bacteriovorus W]|nr:hypothetical protein BDW_08440 [Bdellovibrio bacteriovorus W]